MNRFTRVVLHTILWILGSLISIVLLLVLLIQLPSVQNYLTKQATSYLENKIGTKVEIGYINITFPKKIVLEKVYFEDQSRDTLIAGEKLRVDIDMFKLLSNTIKVQEIDLEGITGKIKRDSSGNFNFNYILDAFVSEKKAVDKPTSDSSSLVFDIDKVNLDRIQFTYTDYLISTSAKIVLNHLDTRIKTFDLNKNMSFNLPKININGLNALIKQWELPKNKTISTVENISTTLLPNIATNDIELQNIFIKYQDISSSLDTKFDIKKLHAAIDLIDLNKEIVKLKEINLEQSDSYVIFQKAPKKLKNKTSESKVNWIVSADKIKIDKSNFLFRDDNEARMKGFDYFNIGIKDLAASLNELYYSNNSISGSLANLTAKDHSGFNLRRVKGDFVYTNTGAQIKNLIAETPKSIIKDYIKISYPSLEAVSKHPNLLNIDANIVKTQIDMTDIRYFAPFLDTMDVMRPLLTNKFNIDGKIRGKLDNLHILSLNFKTLSNTEIIASAHIQGLPDTERMQIALNLKKLITGKNDLNNLIDKSLLPKGFEFEYPNSISLSGNFTGGLKGFETDLNLITEKGDAKVNGYLKMGKRDTTYDATVSIDNFHLGHFLKQDSTLGYVSAQAKVKGTGLNPKSMSADIDASIQNLDALGYAYHDISLNMQTNQGILAGNLKSIDPNIRFNVDLNGNLANQYPKVNFNMMIDSVNLQNLKLVNDNIRYHGKITGDFKTADLNYLNGRIDVTNSSIAYNNDRYSLDSISLIAYADTNRNSIILKSEILKAHLVGKFRLTELGDAVQDVVKIYYNPNNEPPSSLNYTNQNFEFSATINNSRFLRDFLPSLEKMENITLDGTFNSAQKSLMAKLIAPELIYSGIHIKDVGVDIITVDSTMYYSALIDKIKINNIELNNTTLSGRAIENNFELGLWIKDKFDVDRYHLGGEMSINKNNYVFSLSENGLMLNYDTWNIALDNQLSFGKSGIQARNFKLSKDDQLLLIESKDSTLNSPLSVRFNNFRIETFANMIESESLELGGGINGEATISRLESNPVIVSDIDIDKFYFGKDTIGNICLDINNLKENTYSANISIADYGNEIQLEGEYYSPPNKKATFNADLNVKKLKIKTIENFSMGYIKNAEGYLDGGLKLTGSLDDFKINGDLKFNKSRINISLLNADFLIDDQKIQFNDKGIAFRLFELKDLKGNTAKLNGSIFTNKSYTDFDFNLNFSTNNFAVVNSSRIDNNLFYGKLFVTSNIRITGDLHKPNIDGTIKVNNNTDFVFVVPNENPGVAERDGVVKFVNKSDTAKVNVFAKLDSLKTVHQLSGFNMNLNLNTDRDAKFKVVLNEGTQDALNIQGVAELTASKDASEKITLSGTYTVENGNYSFSFGPFKKEFDFQKGSTITWNGDPLDARLDITALYSRRISPLELVSNQIGNQNENLYKQKIPFNVKLILTGELFKPEINFDIDLAENNSVASQDVISKVDNALATLRNDPAELNKQVFAVIVLGNFMSANPFSNVSGGSFGEGIARSTVSTFLSNQLNNLASNLIKGIDLDFNLQSEQDYLSGNTQARTDLNINLSKMLFDDRLKITIGSNFEVEGETRPGENPNNIAGDISIEYQLSKDGRYFVRAYRKNEYQATLQGQFVETGIGFIVNISYNKFKEIFMSEKALAKYFDTESNSFRKRFNVERMESDSLYRDSVRLVIRDSLMKHSPDFRKRMLENEKQEALKKQENSTPTTPSDTSINYKQTGIRNEEEEERKQNEK